MKTVLDSAAILNSFTGFDLSEGEFLTVREVINEMKDFASRTKTQAAIESNQLKVKMPSADSVKKIKSFDARRKLSKTDLSVLALALDEQPCILITDDYAVQSVAKQLKIDFKGVAFKEINH